MAKNESPPTTQPPGRGRVLLGLLAIAVGIGVAIAVAPGVGPKQPLTRPDPAADADACRAAIPTVQQYRAPGQRLTVEANAELVAASGRQPVRLGAWTARGSTANRCIISLGAVVGNEPRTFAWTYNRDTGAVTADDDATKRLSGW